jgi:CelD/BcsL family acetyltransferase involved in cellulose biosynthesis
MGSGDQTIADIFSSYPFQGPGPAMRRPVPAPPLRGVRSGPEHQAGASIDVVVFGLIQAGDHEEAWRDLAGRSLERNVFYEPDFALAAARHLREAPRPAFVFAWDAQKPRQPDALLGVFPIAMPTFGFGSMELLGWRHDQAVLGTPLIDGGRSEEVIEHFLGWVSRATAISGGIMLPMIREDGPTAAALRAVAARTGREIRRFSAHERAVLPAGEEADALLARAMPGKRMKEYRRLRRRLEEKGPVSFVSATTSQEVREAAEAFLDLEEAGWKGRDGGALLHTASGASFLRAATRTMALRGACRIDMLLVDGDPVAAGIVLKAGSLSYFWKTAFDERLAALSPGVQLTLEITRRQLADPEVTLTDSCAVADHPMINHVWPDRAPVADWFVPGASNGAANLVIAREAASRRLRNAAKTLYRRMKSKG